MPAPLTVRYLGRVGYGPAYAEQLAAHARVLAARGDPTSAPGEILLVEHDPVITVTRRPGAAEHVLAPERLLAAQGVGLHETDRGGDVTYHGPGQIVAYPVLDLNRLGLRLHDYLRTLEQSVIDLCDDLGLPAGRDACATGVWIEPGDRSPHAEPAKVCAIGVRVRKWVTLHGLALNVRTNLDHFRLIVPCGLHGRPVTSLSEQLGGACPPTEAVRDALAESLQRRLADPVRESPQRSNCAN